MELTDEMRAAISEAIGVDKYFVLPNGTFVKACMVGYRMGQRDMRERAAKTADEFDFGLDSQAGLVRDLRSLPVEDANG